MIKNYDLESMRVALIGQLSSNLHKKSKFYRDDYVSICKAVGQKTRKELIDSINNQKVLKALTPEYFEQHCQF